MIVLHQSNVPFPRWFIYCLKSIKCTANFLGGPYTAICQSNTVNIPDSLYIAPCQLHVPLIY